MADADDKTRNPRHRDAIKVEIAEVDRFRKLGIARGEKRDTRRLDDLLDEMLEDKS